MAEQLDLHVASAAEREQAFRNVHEFWGRGMPLATYVEQRLKSAKHNLATWYVGCLDGQVVASLGCYPIQLRLHGRTITAIALGSVHTLLQHRGRGYAPRLIRFVETSEQARGAGASVLYSDISPGYYARLGYVQCPGWSGAIELPTSSPSPSSGGAELIRLDPDHERAALRDLYDTYHAQFPLSIARSLHYWNSLLAREPNDEFYWLSLPHNSRAGYARVRRKNDVLSIHDFALAADAGRLLEELCLAVLQLSRRDCMKRVTGWLPDSAEVRAHIPLSKRAQEITMVKALRPDVKLDAPACEAANYFHEIDHV